jgi:hypothetical protein
MKDAIEFLVDTVALLVAIWFLMFVFPFLVGGTP